MGTDNTGRSRMTRAAAIMLGACAAILGACSAGTDNTPAAPQEEETMPVDLTIYSPAPPQIMLHAHNAEMGQLLEACEAFGTVTTPPVALPDSINRINALPADQRPYHLPIVTTLDFETARHATAPDWHGYERANEDLVFVASLYDVAFGVLVFDPAIQSPADLAGKRIAVPPRPSSVRWLSEALLDDGWGILDEVELVDMLPPDLPAAIAEGRIDATSWNIMSETREGFLPLIPPLMDQKGAHWLNVDVETAAAINAASPFTTESVSVAAGRIRSASAGPTEDVSLLSFRQSLAAWADTPDAVVTEILTCLSAASPAYGSAGGFHKDWMKWPALTEDAVHPAALAFRPED